ncbi:SAM-dependent methyltransferase [Seminavis robusta]|uniref:SAM-dependent methyltransferase n=1 Tax=Seminavis robusta TaxID=568900 RepID=A0A9N8HQD3_9STRA|nr:SAM-dependent methyltransferase [Seminavis robusta]|eukprot:Sro1275_g258440.1 SAM-dependent methyltransferase (313) ;mRNA; f:1422-2360
MKQRTSLLFLSWISYHSQPAASFCLKANSKWLARIAIREPSCRLYSVDNIKLDDGLVSQAEMAFSILAKRNRTWKRLRHLVDLAQQVKTQECKSLVDVGTDHGILPIALAATAQFETVTGIDISEQVLDNGARATHQEVQNHLKSEKGLSLPSVDFRCGNGLRGLEQGDADIVCIAGMGVNTMLKILGGPETSYLGSQILLLQPTNSKPKNLIHLYDSLQNEQGFLLVEERIEILASRWYISAAFARGKQGDSLQSCLLPGTKLQTCSDNSQKEMFDHYVDHHTSWLAKDQKYGKLEASEQRWLRTFAASHD